MLLMTPNHKLSACMYALFKFSIATTLSKSFIFFILSKCIHIIVIPQKSFDIIFFSSFSPFQMHARCLVVCTYPPATIAYPRLLFESDIICSFSLYNIPNGAFIFKIFQQHNLTLDICFFIYSYNKYL